MQPDPRLIEVIQEVEALVTAERARLPEAAQSRVTAEQQQISLATQIRDDSQFDPTVRDTAGKAAAAGQARIEKVQLLNRQRAQALDQAARNLADLRRSLGGET
jgi:hypothetical protein